MSWNSNLTNLRDVLADLYFMAQDSRRVVEDAGLNPTFIAFDNKAIINWHNILREAQKHNKVQTIIEVAQRDYPENEFLSLARRNGLTTVRGPDIEDWTDWRGETDTGQLEKIIGKQSTFLPISFLELGLEKSRSVARVVLKNGDSGSGFLIDDNLFITNNHVLPTKEGATGAVIQFNYQKSITGLAAPISEFRLASDEVFVTSKKDDWTVVKIQGDANVEWGGIKLTQANIQKENRAIIIHYSDYIDQILSP